jgi:hypothetical protein
VQLAFQSNPIAEVGESASALPAGICRRAAPPATVYTPTISTGLAHPAVVVVFHKLPYPRGFSVDRGMRPSPAK